MKIIRVARSINNNFEPIFNIQINFEEKDLDGPNLTVEEKLEYFSKQFIKAYKDALPMFAS